MKTPSHGPSKFLTMTFFVYMRLAVNVRQTVTVAKRPSGTCVARRRHDTTATLSRGASTVSRRCGFASQRRPRRLPETQNPKRNHARGREMVTRTPRDARSRR